MKIALLFVFGVCFGSFVNALVWRLHKQLNFKSKKTASTYSITKGRSMCPNCKHQLNAIDLIPIFSWLSLRGKCRYCKKPIAVQYPLVELAMGFVFAVSYLFWPISLDESKGVFSLAVWLVASVGLMALAVYDLKWFRLPLAVTTPLIVISVLYRIIYILAYETSLKQALLKWIFALLVASGLFYLLYIMSSGKWIGDGDITLGIILGSLLGSPELAFLMIFTASVLGLVFSAPKLLKSQDKLKMKIPYGPFLILATFFVMIWGQRLVDWYKALIIIE